MKQIEKFYDTLIQEGYQVKQRVNIANYLSLKIGGDVLYLCEPSTIEEIKFVIQTAKANHLPTCILGNGSNVLFPNELYEGVVLALAPNFHDIQLLGEHCIRALGGSDLKAVCRFAMEQELSGLEFAYGIPATSGGAAYMNAGAYGGEMSQVVASCLYLDETGEIQSIENANMEFAYRHSIFHDKNVCVLQVTYELVKGIRNEIMERMENFMHQRIEKQPLEYPSAGSTFKRPVGSYASLLIAQCGLKGYAVGDAMVSKKHAGFLINTHQATSSDFLQLIEDVQTIVYEKTGFQLECEIKIIR